MRSGGMTCQNDCPAQGETAETVQHFLFGNGIEVGGGFVEEQQRCIL